jgi:hypothetical protein
MCCLRVDSTERSSKDGEPARNEGDPCSHTARDVRTYRLYPLKSPPPPEPEHAAISFLRRLCASVHNQLSGKQPELPVFSSKAESLLEASGCPTQEYAEFATEEQFIQFAAI